MKLLEPLLVGSYSISQRFGGNANPLYAGQGLKGHPGVDMAQGYNRSITASHDGLVYKTFNKNNPDLSKYRAVCVLFQEDENWYELTYGHCNDIYASVGDMVSSGDLLASMGNTGDVFSQGLPVSPSPSVRLQPPYPGTHLHWQLRKCVRTQSTQAGNQYLQAQDGGLFHDKDGYYEVVDYENGYNGCIDPLPFLYSPPIWKKLPLYIKIVSQLSAVAKGRTS
ncbi:MAG TPA: M23 family metallopeptidase [Blastocatellia bacterium]|nr:M23 family metallopeptidase [Blastocatellia bacterium]